MARTALTPTTAPKSTSAAAAALAFAAADAVNGNEFPLTGREYIVAHNTDGATAHTLTVTSVADPFGRTGDLTQSIPAGGYYVTQVFDVVGWQQADGNLYLSADNAAIELAVVRLP